MNATQPLPAPSRWTPAAADPAPEAVNAARLARQPIVDRRMNLVGFELFYCGATGEPPPSGEGARWTSLMVTDLLAGIGLDRALGIFAGYVNVDHEFLGSRLVEILPPGRIRLELGHTVGNGPEALARAAALRELGYGLVLDGYCGDRSRVDPLLPMLDAIKVDMEAVGAARVAAVVRPFAGGRKALIAEKVSSPAQYQEALSLGFDLFQGYHFARPELMEGRRLRVDLSSLLRLLTLVTDDAEPDAIEAEFKRQPAMSVNLLRLTNSAAAGMRAPARTLREAILRTGLRPMRTWLQLLIYSAGGRGGASPLLHTAAVRGRLMELVALRTRGGEREFADRALMVGLLSLMHVVFGTTQDAFAAELRLDEDIRAALAARAGPLGRLLAMVESREGVAASPAPVVDESELGRLEMEAFAWASEVAAGGAT